MEESSTEILIGSLLTDNFKFILTGTNGSESVADANADIFDEKDYRQNIQDIAHYLDITINKEKNLEGQQIVATTVNTKTTYDALSEQEGADRVLYFIEVN